MLEQIIQNQQKTNELLEALVYLNKEALTIIMNEQPEVAKFFEDKVNEGS